MAYQLLKDTEKKDKEKDKEETEKEEGEKEEEGEEKDPKAKKPKTKKSDGSELVVLQPVQGKEYRFEKVTEYTISKKGNMIAFIAAKNDTLERTEVSVFNTKTEKTEVIFKADGISKKMSFDEEGEQLVFMYTADTAKTKIYEIKYWDTKADQAKTLVSENTEGIPEGWSPSALGRLSFSESGKRILIGTKENPEPEEKDTLLDEEKYKVDT